MRLAREADHPGFRWIADKTYELYRWMSRLVSPFRRWRGLIDHLTHQPHNWVDL